MEELVEHHQEEHLETAPFQAIRPSEGHHLKEAIHHPLEEAHPIQGEDQEAHQEDQEVALVQAKIRENSSSFVFIFKFSKFLLTF
jgi:hypothetical protein